MSLEGNSLPIRRPAEFAPRDRAPIRDARFLDLLAHELRNPLAPLRTGIHLLKKARVQEPRVREMHEMLDRQIETLVRLVDDLLDVGRASEGTIELHKERIDARLVIHRSMEQWRDVVARRDHSLEIDLPVFLPVELDALRMIQVMVRLVENAARFTPVGGRIWITARKEGDWAVIRVRDDGEGIPSALLEGIFEPFEKADSSLARQEDGLGLGLTLARRLIELHGGTLSAKSAGAGQGSEFVIRLPLAEDEIAPVARPEEPRTAPPHSSHRVLIVDDNRDAADSLCLLLRLEGHVVREAHDGPSAVALATEFKPELVFLDIGMPGLDGYQVAERLRSDPRTDPAYLVALTGYGSELDRARSRAAGFDHHLVKPADVGDLTSILASLPSGDESVPPPSRAKENPPPLAPPPIAQAGAAA